MANSANASVNRLLRAVSNHNLPATRQAWRELLETGDDAIPLILQKLDSDSWTKKTRGPAGDYLAVLLTLLRWLDPEEFKQEIKRLRSRRLHALHRQTVDLIAKSYGEQVYGKLLGKVPVYISEEIEEPELVYRYLQRWSKTRDLALSDVTRIDVNLYHSKLEYLGLYHIPFGSIVLVWRNDVSGILKRWWRKIQTESTFYHEVGHHYHQHGEGGQIDEQEKEAKQYSSKMFRNAHPIAVPTLRIILFPLWMFLKLYRDLKARNPSADRR